MSLFFFYAGVTILGLLVLSAGLAAGTLTYMFLHLACKKD